MRKNFLSGICKNKLDKKLAEKNINKSKMKI